MNNGYCNFRSTLGYSNSREYRVPYNAKTGTFSPPVPSERREMVALFKWVKLMEATRPELKGLFHVPNGGKRDKATGTQLKKEGVRAGVPDCLLLVARGPYHGLAIELKRENGGRLSQNQRAWKNRLEANGYRFAECKGAVAATKEIESYLSLGEYFRADVEAIEGVLAGICND